MTKRSLIHPKLKTALSSLDLEIEAEINRYQNQKTAHPPKNSFRGQSVEIIPENSTQQSQPIQIWYNQVVTTNIPEQPTANVWAVFKQPLGILSILITMISSSLLGINLTKPLQLESNQQPESLSTPALVQGVNLASEDVELNLQTLSTLSNPQTKPVTESQKPINSNRQPQSQLFNQLLLNQTTERNF